MKIFTVRFTFVVSLFIAQNTMLIIEAGKKNDCSIGITKYVQAGACGKGIGTQECPYSSLALAQADTSWQTLIVLPSATTLDGGITLRPGTKLIGSKNPTGIALSPDQPTVTNSSDAQNGGNGVVVIGDAVIENIYFKNTWAAAIRYDDATNISVKNVLVTGHNQGNVISSINFPIASFTAFEVAGIHGQTKNTGKTKIDNVIIRNNHTGSGILEQPYQGAQRKIVVNHYECAEITSTDLSSLIASSRGIYIVTGEQGTTADVAIKNSYFHDFLPKANLDQSNLAIVLTPQQGSKLKVCIDNSSFYKIQAIPQFQAFGIIAENFFEAGQAGNKPILELLVDSCNFEEPIENAGQFVTGVQLQTAVSSYTLVVKNSTLTNIYDTFISYLSGDGNQKIRLLDNNAKGFETFYTAFSLLQNGIPGEKFTDVVIKGNIYKGGDSIGAIGIIPNVDGTDSPWNRITICAEDNCFDGQGTGLAGLAGIDFGTAGAGNATIKASKNNIVGYNYDILDLGANVNYLAPRNWWGQGASCSTAGDCATTQICNNGVCVGPDNVVNLGTGVVDVSDPLTSPIKCPHSCVAKNMILKGSTIGLNGKIDGEKIDALKKRMIARLSEKN